MPRVVIDSAESKALKNEIAHLRGLDLGGLRARWHTTFRRRAPSHLQRHLLFRILAYRLQADRLGDLDADSRRLLDGSEPVDGIDRLVADLNRSRNELRPGTLLTREWDGQLQRVTVLADGFSWNGNTYACPRSPSPSPVRAGMVPGFSACAIGHPRRSDREERDDQIGSLRHLYPRVDRSRA